MSESLKSLIASGPKLGLDSIDPDLIKHNTAHGATGATSNPIIVAVSARATDAEVWTKPADLEFKSSATVDVWQSTGGPSAFLALGRSARLRQNW